MTKYDEKMMDEILRVIEKYKPFALNDIREVYNRSGCSIDNVLLLIKIVKEYGLKGTFNKLADLVKGGKV